MSAVTNWYQIFPRWPGGDDGRDSGPEGGPGQATVRASGRQPQDQRLHHEHVGPNPAK